jgi:transposase
MICQLHQLLPGLIPGGAKKALSAAQATALLATVRPRDAAGKARRRVAAELISDLERHCQRNKAAGKDLRDLLSATGTTLTSRNGIGPPAAARLLAQTRDITRFPGKAHFASGNRTAPAGASCGDQVRHRLSRAGNRQINRALPIMAIVQPPPPRQRGPRLPRPQRRRRDDPDGSHEMPQPQAARHRLPPDDPRPPGSTSGPGRTHGGVCHIQRGRLTPRRRHFG